jgi:rhamnogalacturonyl hydrolase YesR
MISPALISKVLSQARISAKHSWEYGTIFEALLEYNNPEFAIFNNPFPNDSGIPVLDENEVPALQYIKPFIITNSNRLCEGQGSSSDPCSLGIPALLLSKSKNAGNHGKKYADAVARQLDAVLTKTPRFPNGAISHRDEYASAWVRQSNTTHPFSLTQPIHPYNTASHTTQADFIYMLPPLLAYHGFTTPSLPLLTLSVHQCTLYSSILQHPSGCWSHIIDAPGTAHLSTKQDPGLWSSSNGWAAAGMSRVLSTIRHASPSFRSSLAEEEKRLVQMIKGIISGARNFDTHPSGLLRNRLDDESWFGEVAGTALIAATAFRMAVLEPDVFDSTYTEWAMRKMDNIEGCVHQSSGIVAPVVNPTSDEQCTPLVGVSPEAQAFVVMMYAAWRDWDRVQRREM